MSVNVVVVLWFLYQDTLMMKRGFTEWNTKKSNFVCQRSIKGGRKMTIMLLFVLDFLLTSLGFWIVTLLLPCLGITFAFTWGKALVVWVICKVVRLLMH